MRMGEEPYKNWNEVKADIIRWRRANLCCIALGLIFILAGAVAGLIISEFTMIPLYLFMIAIFFVVLSIAPHIHVVALKSWYGIESERKK
jgi:hypothetical protein